MFSEILKILPRLDNGDLNRMDNQLSKRFGRIAKKFGKGLMGAIAGGGLLGLASSLIDKLLNPLKEVQEAIDKTLAASDDVVTNAKQFGTTAGKLFKLKGLGEATGLEAGDLYMLIGKFQQAVAEANADPTKDTAVRNFAAIPDTADAFFEFIQALQKMTREQQLMVQQEIFGEKQTLKMADFLQSDFGDLMKRIGAKSSEAYTPRLEKLGAAKDFQDELRVAREMNDIFRKADVIQGDFMLSQDAAARAELARENQRITQYENLNTISMKSAQIMDILERGYQDILDIAINARSMNSIMQKLTGSRMLRGIMNMIGDK